ncbi:MAG: rRNA maturation RNase YbeY [Nitrospinales bacterium]
MEILFRNAQRKYKINRPRLISHIEKIMTELKQIDSEISIMLVNDAKIRELNRDYRDRNEATDVLAFPQDEDALNDCGGALLGDVVVSVETSRRQAKEHCLSGDEEIILLIIHGTLHLLGYDHERSTKDKIKMQNLTQKIFNRLFPGRQPLGNSDF